MVLLLVEFKVGKQVDTSDSLSGSRSWQRFAGVPVGAQDKNETHAGVDSRGMSPKKVGRIFHHSSFGEVAT